MKQLTLRSSLRVKVVELIRVKMDGVKVKVRVTLRSNQTTILTKLCFEAISREADRNSNSTISRENLLLHVLLIEETENYPGQQFL